MEAIKKYLDSMFAQMPNTPEVRRAREELLAMMEDKYNELIAEGRSDNEAVGTVISEFGNLSELAETLGISHVFTENRAQGGRAPMDMEDMENYIQAGITKALLRSAGIFFCIISVVFPILLDGLGFLGGSLFFVSVGFGVLLIVYSSGLVSKYKRLFTGEFYLDYAATKYVNDMKHQFENTSNLLRSLGIMLCVICFVPAIILDNNVRLIGRLTLSDLGGALLFILVGFGVFLIVYSANVMGTFKKLLKLNDESTISGTYKEQARRDRGDSSYNYSNSSFSGTNYNDGYSGKKEKKNKKNEVYNNSLAEFVASVYWPTVTCLYLIWSFQTFSWAISWIIFPIASAARRPILRYLNNRESGSSQGDVIDAQYTEIKSQSGESKED